MSNSNSNSNGNGSTSTTSASVGRESRSNHAPAAANPITNSASAQAFCDAAIDATRNDKPASMFNASGFVTPGSLDGQSVQNRLRMASSLINSLAGTVEQGGAEGQAASDALRIIGEYSGTASAARENARNERILAEADAIRARQGKGQKATRA